MAGVIRPTFDLIEYNANIADINLNASDPLLFSDITKNISIYDASSTKKGVVSLGNQTFAGTKTFSSVPICSTQPSSSGELCNKGYVDSFASGMSWKNPVTSFFDFGGAIPPTLVNGQRYISSTTSGSFDANYIYEYNGSSWVEIVPSEGWCLYVMGGSTFADQTIVYTSAGAWVSIGNVINHSSLNGLTSGDDHTQYVKVSGRANENITVNGTETITSTTANQLTVGYDGSNKMTFNVASNGKASFDTTGNELSFASNDVIKVLNSAGADAGALTAGCVMEGGLVVKETIVAGGRSMVSVGGYGPELSYQNSKCYIGGVRHGVSYIPLYVQPISQFIVENTTDSSSKDTGSFITEGGIGIEKSAYIGGSINAYNSCSTGLSTTGMMFMSSYYSSLNGDYGGGVLTGTTSGTVSITSGKLVLGTGQGNNVRYNAVNNANFTQTGTIRFKFTPNFTTIATNTGIIGIGKTSVNDNSLYFFLNSSNSNLSLAVCNSSGTKTISDVGFGAWTWVNGQEYEFELNCDFTTPATRLFIDGALFGTPITTSVTRTSTSLEQLQVGSYIITPTNDLSNFSIRDLVVYNTIQHTTSYTKGYTTQTTLNVTGQTNMYGRLNSLAPTSITSANPTQLELGYDGTNKTLFQVSSAGDLTIDCSGNDLNLASTDIVHILNTTASTSKDSGCAVFEGGVGIESALFAGGVITTNTGYNSRINYNGSSACFDGTNSGMTAGQSHYFSVGKANTQKNCSIFMFNYSADDSASNYCAMGVYGYNDKVKMYQDRMECGFTTASTSTGTGSMLVGGGLGVNGKIFCTGLSVSGVDYGYNEASGNLTFGGAVPNTSIAYRAVRIGKSVSIFIAYFVVSTNAIATITTSALDSTYRPPENQRCTYMVNIGGTYAMARCDVNSNGTLTFYKELDSTYGNFASGTAVIFGPLSLSYVV